MFPRYYVIETGLSDFHKMSATVMKMYYNHVHNILRFFDELPNDLRLKTWDLTKLGNIRKISKFHRIIA